MVFRRNAKRRPTRRPFRRNIRRRGRTATQTRVPRGLTPSVYRFKRDIEATIALDPSSPPEGWTADGGSRIYNQFGYSLGALGDNSDFVNLFAQYRLKGARIRMYFSNTTSGAMGNSNSNANTQLLVRMAPNQSGQIDTLNDAFWAQAQAKKYKMAINGGRPLDIYMPLKQANLVTSSTGSANTLMSPKFIDTAVGNVVHYGMNLSVERVDGQGLSAGSGNYQYCKLITTIYLECRRVA